MTSEEIIDAIPRTLLVLSITELPEDAVIEKLKEAGRDAGVEMTPDAEAAFRESYRASHRGTK